MPARIFTVRFSGQGYPELMTMLVKVGVVVIIPSSAGQPQKLSAKDSSPLGKPGIPERQAPGQVPAN